MENNYLKKLNLDSDHAHEYYSKSINKTEHQKFLEAYLRKIEIGNKKIELLILPVDMEW